MSDLTKIAAQKFLNFRDAERAINARHDGDFALFGEAQADIDDLPDDGPAAAFVKADLDLAEMAIAHEPDSARFHTLRTRLRLLMPAALRAELEAMRPSAFV